MRDKHQGKGKRPPKPPKYAQRCISALRKGLSGPLKASGKFWESVLVEKVKTYISHAIPYHKSWDSIERSQVLDNHAKWIVQEKGTHFVDEQGKDGKILEL